MTEIGIIPQRYWVIEFPEGEESKTAAVFDLPVDKCDMKTAVAEATLMMEEYYKNRLLRYNQTRVQVVDTETRQNQFFWYSAPHRAN